MDAISHDDAPSQSADRLGTTVDLTAPELYINREISWLQFNWRVLEEALDTTYPLLERVKFLAIFASNLDEFFMIRIAGLRHQVTDGVLTAPPDGLTPSEQLAKIREVLNDHLAHHAACWRQDLLPKLAEADIRILAYDALSPQQQRHLRDYFAQEIFPTLTPLAFDPAHPFPHISNLSLNLAVVVQTPRGGERFARLKVPDIFPRLVRIPKADQLGETVVPPGATDVLSTHFVWLEDLIAANLDMLFPGLEVVASYPFRVTRDADLDIQDDEAGDLLTPPDSGASNLLTAVEQQIGRRHFGFVIRLEITPSTPEHIQNILTRNLELAPYQVYIVDAPLGMADLMELHRIDRPDLKDAPFWPTLPVSLTKHDTLFQAIREQDILLCHPYDSFLPVVDFVREAANDPNVLAIKQTLYRVGPNSPIVQALMEARRNRKQVAVILELKARFDEENNIVWARALEDEGVHVVYGVMRLKTHAKMCLVVRREANGMRHYVHMGTGNYNALTSRIYTDLGYFTCDPDIGADVAKLFNALTGYAYQEVYRKLLVAPGSLRREILRRIEREIERQERYGDGYMAFKMNALVDPACIQALYRASQAGVRIDLQVRGICCLRPGLPGVSETIAVTSIVGRFLEHARLYYFYNGGDEDIFLGSADLMPRNLDRRVELLFPVKDALARQTLIQDVLRVHLDDNAKARVMASDGSYTSRQAPSEAEALSAQTWLLQHWNAST